MQRFTHFLIFITLFLAGCTSSTPQPASGKLYVVATTTIVGDMIANIGGEAVELTVLLPAGTDPHSFQPTPRDAVKLADAGVIFINGAGLETFLDKLLENSASQAQVVDLSTGITLLQGGHEHEGEEHDDDDHAQGDPHVWTDPNNILLWVDSAEQVLSRLDPANAALYQANAAAYRAQLTGLDGWIKTQVEQVPPERRKLVMDHEILGYFAQRYGFELVGAIIPGFSSASEPSAQELAALEDAMRSLGAPAIFVSFEVSPALAQRVAGDTGVQLATIYSGSLSLPGGPADTYLKFTRYNVTVIVEALK